MLLVRKKNSEYFQLTGGKINANETEIETVIREIKEEIGLELQSNQLNHLGVHETKAVNETETLVHGSIFIVQLKHIFIPQIDNEIAAYIWINKSNYKNYKWAHLAEEFVQPWWLKLHSS